MYIYIYIYDISRLRVNDTTWSIENNTNILRKVTSGDPCNINAEIFLVL
jgi:hypothetical protein